MINFNKNIFFQNIGTLNLIIIRKHQYFFMYI